MTHSWWLDLARSEFYRQVVTEARRMQCDPKAKHVSTHPDQFSPPPKKRPATSYGYADEADKVEV